MQTTKPIMPSEDFSEFKAKPALREQNRREFEHLLQRQEREPSNKQEASQTLRSLRALQEARVPVPMDPDEFIQSKEELMDLAELPTTNKELFYLLFWNEIALDLTAQDHTKLIGEEPNPTFAEQIGPARSSRALAIAHLAMFEAVNTVARRFASYKDLQQIIFESTQIPKDIAANQVSLSHAITEAAWGTLISLYPNKKPFVDAARIKVLTQLNSTPTQLAETGTIIGRAAARAILDNRKSDKSDHEEPMAKDFEAPSEPFRWRKDPLNEPAVALGGKWSQVTPFVLTSAKIFRPPPPPPVDSAAFATAYNDVKEKGGDPNAPIGSDRRPTSTTRTGVELVSPGRDNETFVGIFWGYDGTALLCAPPRLYNMIACSIATGERPINDVVDMARYLALVNVAMADAGIAAWEAKFHFRYARPVTGIRLAPDDENSEVKHQEFWTPFGAPVTNGQPNSRNFSPPFPAYPSGHATFGGALFQTFRRYYGTAPEDEMPTMPGSPTTNTSFKFVSDEYNGKNHPPGGPARPHFEAEFHSFKDAEAENARSRIYLGIHWQFDADNGIKQGNKVADFVFDNILQPIA